MLKEWKEACTSNLGIFLFFLLLFIFLTWNLDADPSLFKRWGDVGDEGYWFHNARNWILTGHFILPDDNFNQALIGAPFYTILLTIVFKFFGISFFTGRLLSVISLISICLFVYHGLYSMRIKKILIFVPIILLTFNHSILTYFRWGTPIPIQMLCELITFFSFYHYSVTGRLGWAFGAGVAASLVPLAKLSGAIFILPAGLMFLIAGYAQLSYGWKRYVVAVGAGFFLVASFALVFLLPHFSQIELFRISIMADNGDGKLVFENILQRILEVWNLLPLTMPWNKSIMVVCLVALLSLTLNLILQLKSKKNPCRTMFSRLLLAWFFSEWMMLALCSDKVDRRIFVVLLPSILTTSWWIINFIQPETNYDVCDLKKSRLVNSFNCLMNRGLILLAVYILLQNEFFNVQFSASLLFLAGLSIIIISFFSYRNILFGLVLVGLLFIPNIKPLLSWYSRPTFTLRDSSRALSSFVQAGDCFSGTAAHWLAIEAGDLRPIWYLKKSGALSLINANFLERFPYETSCSRLFLVECKKFESTENTLDLNKVYLVPSDFPSYISKSLLTIQIGSQSQSMDSPPIQNWRYVGEFYLLTQKK